MNVRQKKKRIKLKAKNNIPLTVSENKWLTQYIIRKRLKSCIKAIKKLGLALQRLSTNLTNTARVFSERINSINK